MQNSDRDVEELQRKQNSYKDTTTQPDRHT